MKIDTSQPVTLGFKKMQKHSLKVKSYKATQGTKLHATFLGLELIYQAFYDGFLSHEISL